MHNKKAAIGAAMTWVVATIIILLVIILFVYASGILSLGRPGGDIILKETSTNSEQILLALLDTKIDGKTVKQLVIEEDKDSLNNLKSILEKIPVSCEWDKKTDRSTWSFFYKDVDKSNVRSAVVISKIAFPLDPPKDNNPTVSIVYLPNNKIVKFYENC